MRLSLVLVGYVALGWVALQLAIPPGYATPVWPAAGLALIATIAWGRRVVPAVGLASFVVNAAGSLAAGQEPVAPVALAAAAGIALGAALQALVGDWLVRRFVRFPPPLYDAREVGLLLALGGPLACLTSATIGVGALLVTSTLTPSQLAYSWFTWWVGDTIGVLVVAPIALVEIASPADLWRRRRFSLAVPIVLGSALLAGFFVYASDRENLRLQADFRRRTEVLTRVLHVELRAQAEVLEGFARFVGSSGTADRAALRDFVERTRATHPAFDALDHGSVASLSGRLGTAAARSVRGVAERRALDTLATVPYRAGPDRRPKFALVAPLSNGGRAGEPQLALAVVDVRRLVATALRRADTRGIELRLSDVADGQPPRPLTSVGGAGSTRGAALEADGSRRSGEQAIAWQDESFVPVGGRTWRLSFAPSAEFAFLHRSRDAWTVLVIGLLFTSLLGAFQLTVTGRSVQVEAQLREGTDALRRSEEQLRRSLDEKDVLLAEVHHRVKNNLQVISSLLGLQFPETPVPRGIEEMRGRIASIALVHEQLYRSEDLARIGLARYLRNLVEALASQHGFEPARLHVVVSAEQEVQLGVDAAIPCGLIANELVTNCLKHAFPGGRSGRIEVALRRTADGQASLEVADDGVGLPVGRDPLQGETLGLRLVKTLASQLGGTVLIEGGAGTRVVVTFPLGGKARGTRR